jgi:hypothetical protein
VHEHQLPQHVYLIRVLLMITALISPYLHGAHDTAVQRASMDRFKQPYLYHVDMLSN